MKYRSLNPIAAFFILLSCWMCFCVCADAGHVVMISECTNSQICERDVRGRRKVDIE